MANSLSGTITLSGAPTQARVTAYNVSTGLAVASVLSNATTGKWNITPLPAGTYEIFITKSGYKGRCDGPWTLDGTDPYYSNVVSLLHFDGVDGSTTFTDEKGKTWTRSGNTQIDTAQFKFGGASALFDGSGDALSTPNNTDFAFGSGDFCIEGFVRPAAIGTTQTLFRKSAGVDYSPVLIQITPTGEFDAFISSDNSAPWEASLIGPTIVAGTQYHFAVTRSGNTVRWFVGGVLYQSATLSAGLSLLVNTSSVYLGNNATLAQSFNGHLDEVRITKGAARYTDHFNPPINAFPNS